MGPRGFWVALAIVLFYLVARPHVGTVWYIQTDDAKPQPIVSNWATDVRPAPTNPFLSTPTATPAAQRSPTRAVFTEKLDCESVASDYARDAGLTGIYCAPKNALLWGW